MQDGFLRVYFSDSAWTTIPANQSSTTLGIITTIAKKRGIPFNQQNDPNASNVPFTLSILDISSVSSFERVLELHENPLKIQQLLAQHGQTENFRFFAKTAKKKRNQSARNAENNNSSGSDDEDTLEQYNRILLEKNKANNTVGISNEKGLEKCGYMLKGGKKESDHYKQRYFELYKNKIVYYKSHISKESISTIELHDAFVKPTFLHNLYSHNTQSLAIQPSKPEYSFLQSSPAASSHILYDFEIHGKQRFHYFRCNSYNDYVDWIQHLWHYTQQIYWENQAVVEIQAEIDNFTYYDSNVDEIRLKELKNLDIVLLDCYGLDYFLAFLKENHCEENLLFWLDCEDLKLLIAKQNHNNYLENNKELYNIYTAIVDIYNNYFQDAAPNEIDCKSQLKELYKAQVGLIQAQLSTKSYNPDLIQLDLYNSMQQNTYNLMNSSNFLAFLQSNHFEKAVLRIPLEDNPTIQQFVRSNLYRAALSKTKFIHNSYNSYEISQEKNNSGPVLAQKPSETPFNPRNQRFSAWFNYFQRCPEQILYSSEEESEEIEEIGDNQEQLGPTDENSGNGSEHKRGFAQTAHHALYHDIRGRKKRNRPKGSGFREQQQQASQLSGGITLLQGERGGKAKSSAPAVTNLQNSSRKSNLPEYSPETTNPANFIKIPSVKTIRAASPASPTASNSTGTAGSSALSSSAKQFSYVSKNQATFSVPSSSNSLLSAHNRGGSTANNRGWQEATVLSVPSPQQRSKNSSVASSTTAGSLSSTPNTANSLLNRTSNASSSSNISASPPLNHSNQLNTHSNSLAREPPALSSSPTQYLANVAPVAAASPTHRGIPAQSGGRVQINTGKTAQSESMSNISSPDHRSSALSASSPLRSPATQPSLFSKPSNNPNESMSSSADNLINSNNNRAPGISIDTSGSTPRSLGSRLANSPFFQFAQQQLQSQTPIAAAKPSSPRPMN
jgi:hypothetical protein